MWIKLLPLQNSLDCQSEVKSLRSIVGASQKSVMFNLCVFEKIENTSSITIGQSMVKVKTKNGKQKNINSNQSSFSFSNLNLKIIRTPGEMKEFFFHNIFNGNEEKFDCMIPLLNAFLCGDGACIMTHGETGKYFS